MSATSLNAAIDLATTYPLEQEAMLALPLGYEPDPWPRLPRIAIMFHAFHIELVPEFRAYLSHIPFPADLFLTTDSAEKQARLAVLFADWPQGQVTFLVTPNRGRDIAPKLVGLGPAHTGYDLVLHLHTKHSSHESGLGGWRAYLLETLLGSSAVVRGVLESFRQWPNLGMLAPQHIDQLRPWIRWGENYGQAAMLAERMGFPLPRRAPLDFPSGSMFWARPAALQPLIGLGLRFEEFQDETGQTDGTLAHAVERLYFFACEAAGLDWMKITRPGMLHEQVGLEEAHSPAELRRVLGRSILHLQTLRENRRPFADEPDIPFFPPRPKRLPYLPWRAITGDQTKPVTGHAAVLFCQTEPVEERQALAAQAALRAVLPQGGLEPPLHRAAVSSGQLAGEIAQRFAEGADLVFLMRKPGLLHPGAIAALLRMAQAQEGRALLEPAFLPPGVAQRTPAEDFELDQSAGDAIAIPRAAYAAMAPLDPADGEEAGLRSLHARARATGIPLLLCPDALIFPDAAVPILPDQDAAGLDILLRLEDEADLPQVERLLFTILGQRSPLSLTVHFMLTRFPQTGLRALRRRADRLRHLNPAARLLFHNWDEPTPFDVRAALLNQGLAVAEGRYLMALEVSDLLYPQAIARLWMRLSTAQATLALGGIHTAPVIWWGETFLPRVPYSPPQPSLFMLDRTRLPPRAAAFRRTAQNAEIDAFILDVRSTHPVDLTEASTALCLRQMPL